MKIIETVQKGIAELVDAKEEEAELVAPQLDNPLEGGKTDLIVKGVHLVFRAIRMQDTNDYPEEIRQAIRDIASGEYVDDERTHALRPIANRIADLV